MPPPLASPPFETFPEIPGEPARLAVLASGSGSNFEAVVEAADNGELDATVERMICNNPGAGVLERAERLGVPSSLVDHREFDDREAFDERVLREVRAGGADWIVMAGWMRIVTATFIGAYQGRIFNIHPSLLPSFPGIHAVAEALEAGVTITGCTVHLVTEEVDAGPVVAQAALAVDPDDDLGSLQERIHELEHWLFPRAIAHVIAEERAEP